MSLLLARSATCPRTFRYPPRSGGCPTKMIESATPCITVSVKPGFHVLAASATFTELVSRNVGEDEEVSCWDLLSCSSSGVDRCQAESCPLVMVYRSEEKFLENVPVYLRSNGNLVPTTAQFCALWEPWGSYVSIWFGPADAYE